MMAPPALLFAPSLIRALLRQEEVLPLLKHLSMQTRERGERKAADAPALTGGRDNVQAITSSSTGERQADLATASLLLHAQLTPSPPS